MDLQISVFLLFILFTAGHSFNCYYCLSFTGSCTTKKVKTCPSGFSKCVSLTTTTEAGSIKAKDCAVGCGSGSINVGTAKNSLVCCNTDQCNTQDAPDPSNVPNGKTCYSCDGQSCSNILSCSGSEDLCFKGTANIGGQSKVLKGCISKSICNGTTVVTDVQGVSCCEGNLCNGAQSVTQSFLFLCCSLLSFILLH